MKSEFVVVNEGKREVGADMAVCVICDGKVFNAYVVEGAEHIHLLCTQCGAWYCAVNFSNDHLHNTNEMGDPYDY